MSALRVLIDPPGDPAGNMAADDLLARGVRQSLAPPTLRVYHWEQPAISFGRRQRPENLPEEILQRALPLVQRPTGGGAVVHGTADLTYALAMPLRMAPRGVAFHQMTGFVHQRLRGRLVADGLVSAEEIQTFQRPLRSPCVVCFSTPVAGDLVYRGRKVAGAALRVWRDGLLMQGSIQNLPVPHRALLRCFLEAVAQGFRRV